MNGVLFSAQLLQFSHPKKISFYRNAKIFRTIMYFTATIRGWYEVDKKGHTNIGYCQTLETTK
jgi:hypothetical protein